MAKAKKEVIVEKKPEVPKAEPKVEAEQPLNVSEMTIIEIMHQKNISREAAISFLKDNQNK